MRQMAKHSAPRLVVAETIENEKVNERKGLGSVCLEACAMAEIIYGGDQCWYRAIIHSLLVNLTY